MLTSCGAPFSTLLCLFINESNEEEEEGKCQGKVSTLELIKQIQYFVI